MDRGVKVFVIIKGGIQTRLLSERTGPGIITEVSSSSPPFHKAMRKSTPLTQRTHSPVFSAKAAAEKLRRNGFERVRVHPILCFHRWARPSPA